MNPIVCQFCQQQTVPLRASLTYESYDWRCEPCQASYFHTIRERKKILYCISLDHGDYQVNIWPQLKDCTISLKYQKRLPTRTILVINAVPDVNPSNVGEKLKTWLTFS